MLKADSWVRLSTSTLFEAVAGILAAAVVVFLVLWLVARAGRRAEARRRAGLERHRLDLELAVDEQTARLRMIRELHDVVIHSVSVMISQADGAKYAGEQDSAAAVRAIGTIGDAARATLADLRRVMTIVSEGEADIGQQPQLGSIRELLRIMREAGLAIEFEESGTRFELSDGANLAVFRISQEALSNALKHGGQGTHVRIATTWTDTGLQIKFDDDGIRSTLRRGGEDPNQVAQQRSYDIDDDLGALVEAPVGAGITEMRERAALFGGIFTAVLEPGVGFSVSVVFPDLKYHNGVHGVNLDAQ